MPLACTPFSVWLQYTFLFWNYNIMTKESASFMIYGVCLRVCVCVLHTADVPSLHIWGFSHVLCISLSLCGRKWVIGLWVCSCRDNLLTIWLKNYYIHKGVCLQSFSNWKLPYAGDGYLPLNHVVDSVGKLSREVYTQGTKTSCSRALIFSHHR